MSYFTWVYSDATNFLVWEHDDTVAVGWNRNIGTLAQAQGYQVYNNWISVPNTPAQVAGNSYVTFPGGVPAFNQTQYNADQLAQAAAVAKAFTATPQWVYYNQVVTLVAADTAAGHQWTVISQTLFNTWYAWAGTVLAAYTAYVASQTPANLTTFNTALAAYPPMNL